MATQRKSTRSNIGTPPVFYNITEPDLIDREEIRNVLLENGYKYEPYNIGIKVPIIGATYVDITRTDARMMFLDVYTNNIKRSDSSQILGDYNLIPLSKLIKVLNSVKRKFDVPKAKKSSPVKAPTSDRFTLVFSPEGKSVKFNYRIDKGDYETFFGIVFDFFRDQLDEDQVIKIVKAYPEHKDKLYDKETGTYIYDEYTLGEIFDRGFMLGGIKQIDPDVYEINYAT